MCWSGAFLLADACHLTVNSLIHLCDAMLQPLNLGTEILDFLGAARSLLDGLGPAGWTGWTRPSWRLIPMGDLFLQCRAELPEIDNPVLVAVNA